MDNVRGTLRECYRKNMLCLLLQLTSEAQDLSIDGCDCGFSIAYDARCDIGEKRVKLPNEGQMGHRFECKLLNCLDSFPLIDAREWDSMQTSNTNLSGHIPIHA